MNSNKATNTSVTAVMDPAPAASDTSGTTREALQYFPRWVEAGKLIALNGYRLKSYAMFLSQQAPKEVLSDSDLENLLKKCLAPSTDPLDHGIGFVLVHYARDGNYLLASRWYGGNMLKHELFVLSHTAQGWHAEPLVSTNIVACVWELQVITFERQAWVSTAMTRGGTEDSFESYFRMVLEGWV
jgi:hypothetical protein